MSKIFLSAVTFLFGLALPTAYFLTRAGETTFDGIDRSRAAADEASLAASHEATIRRLIEEGWNSGDPAKLREHYGDSVSFRSPLAGRIDSVEGVEQFASGLFRAFPDARMTVTRVIASGSDAFVHFEGSGTNTGPLPNGREATGRSISFEGLAHVVVEDGKVQQDWVYYDALGLFRQLGLAPEE
ncbi:MAG: ester cyclase [Woeseiaceae bacterium]|nr:ester cyclase [Woeseiaceae bacterium]